MWVHWGMRKQALLFWWEGTQTETSMHSCDIYPKAKYAHFLPNNVWSRD